MDIMYFGQLPTPVDVDKDVQMPQFKLIQMSVMDCSQNYTTGTRNEVFDLSGYRGFKMAAVCLYLPHANCLTVIRNHKMPTSCYFSAKSVTVILD